MADNEYPQPLDANPLSSQWSTGFMGGGMMNSLIGQLLMMKMGTAIWPGANPGISQSQSDRLWMRQHSLQMMEVGRNAVTGMFPLQNLGINSSSGFTQAASSFLSTPNNPLMALLSPILGGNPVLAQQSLFAGLQGTNMAAFGTMQGITPANMSQINDSFNRSALNYKPRYEGAKLDEYQAKQLQDIQNNNVSGIEGISNYGKQDVSKLSSLNNNLDIAREQFISGKMSTPEDFKKAFGDLKIKFDPSEWNKMSDAVKNGTDRSAAWNANKQVAAIQQVGAASYNYATAATQQSVTGVNLRATAGFLQEDLYGGFGEAARLRLLGFNANGMAPSEAMNKFMTTGADGSPSQSVMNLDALRGVFGNDKSGKELMGLANQFVGYGSLKNPADLENALRTLSATARVGNLSMGSLLQMGSQMQSLASMSPATAKLGQMELTGAMTSSVIGAAAMSSGMNEQMTRFFGGTGEMASARMQGSISNANQNIEKQLAALYHTGDPTTQAQIARYIKDPNSNKTTVGYNAFLRTLPGNFYSNLSFAQNNVTAQQLGAQDFAKMGLTGKIGGKSNAQQLIQSLYLSMGGPGNKDAIANMSKFYTALGSGNPEALTQLRDVRGNMMLRGPLGDMMMDQLKQGNLDDYVTNPTFQKNRKALETATKQSADFDARVARAMGPMNASTITRLTQAVLSGDAGSLKGIAGALGINEQGGFLTQAFTASNKIDHIRNAKDINAARAEAGGAFAKNDAEFAAGLKNKVNSSQLAQIRMAGITSGSDKRLDDILKGVSAVDRESIVNMTRGELGRTMENFSGTMTNETLNRYMVKQTASDMIDSLPEVQNARTEYKAEMFGGKDADGKVHAGLLKQGGGQFMTALSKIKGFDANTPDEAAKFLRDFQAENKGMVQKTAAGYEVTGKHGELMRANGGTGIFATADAAEKGLEQFSNAINNDPAMQQALVDSSKYGENLDAVQAAKDKTVGASGTDDLASIGAGLQDALKVLANAITGLDKTN